MLRPSTLRIIRMTMKKMIRNRLLSVGRRPDRVGYRARSRDPGASGGATGL